MKKEKISVIIPVYNGEKHLEQCLDSVINQTYRNYEIIVVDDGSNDNSFQICERYRDEYGIVLVSQHNQGVSSARNAGLKKAGGEYICFIDCDDYVGHDALEIMYSIVKKNDCDAVFMPHSYCFETGEVLKRKLRLEDGVYSFNEYENRFIDDGTISGFLLGSVCGVLYRSQIIIDNYILFRSGITTNEDGLFNLEYLRCTRCWCVENNPNCYFYRREWKAYSNSVENVWTKEKKLNITDEALKSVNSEYKIQDFKKQMHSRIATEYMFLTVELQRCGLSYRDFLKYMKQLRTRLKGIKRNDLNWKKMSVYKKAFMCMSFMGDVWISVFMYYLYPRFRNTVKR